MIIKFITILSKINQGSKTLYFLPSCQSGFHFSLSGFRTMLWIFFFFFWSLAFFKSFEKLGLKIFIIWVFKDSFIKEFNIFDQWNIEFFEGWEKFDYGSFSFSTYLKIKNVWWINLSHSWLALYLIYFQASMFLC